MTAFKRFVAAGFLARYGAWAVVTGASSGIGREIARRLAARGFRLAIVARNGEALAALGAELERSGAPVVKSIVLDLTVPGAPRDLAAQVSSLPVGLLVNAAGFGSGGDFLARDVATEAAMIDLNCRAVAELTHHFAARFAAQQRGGIVLLSSIVAFQGVPRSANYAATKAYVQSLGEALADELALSGVDVLVSAPGPTHSGFAERAGMRMGKGEDAGRVAAETLAALGRRRMVVPGPFSKVLYASLMTAPRFLRVRIMKQVMRSMT